MFLVYNQHKAKKILVNKFGYGCWNGGLFTKNEARLTTDHLIRVLV